jgi:hypothetical protein
MFAAGACSNRESPSANTPAVVTISSSPAVGGGALSLTARQVAERIQAAVDASGGYTLTIEQTNFVLPQWGGSDGGTVIIVSGGNGYAARAQLRRTGDGDYTIVRPPARDTAAETLFKRSTCDTWARIPGGGPQVLSPFAFPGTNRIGNGNDAKLETGASLSLTVDGIGQVTITFDPGSFLPLQLSSGTATGNGKPLTWKFADWGKAADIPAVKADYDRGPGGNPC